MVTQKMNGFNHHQRDLSPEWHQKFFDALETVYQNQSYTQANHFFSCLFPVSDDFAFLTSSLQSMILKNQNQPTFLKKLQEKLDYVKRREMCCGQQ